MEKNILIFRKRERPSQYFIFRRAKDCTLDLHRGYVYSMIIQLKRGWKMHIKMEFWITVKQSLDMLTKRRAINPGCLLLMQWLNLQQRRVKNA